MGQRIKGLLYLLLLLLLLFQRAIKIMFFVIQVNNLIVTCKLLKARWNVAIVPEKIISIERKIQRRFLCGKPSIIKFDNCRTEQQWLNMDRTRCRKRLLKKKIRMTKKYLYKLLHETKLFTRYQKHKCFWACSFGGRSNSGRAEKFNIILKSVYFL